MSPTLSFLVLVALASLAVANQHCESGTEEECWHPTFDRSASSRINIAPRETTSDFWVNHAQESIISQLEKTAPKLKVAKNVIFFIGDGLSVPTLAAARTYMGQLEGLNGEEYEMSFEKFPVTGLAKTYCVDYQVADSACTATAYLGGVKNNYGATGVNAAVQFEDCAAQLVEANKVDSIAKWALDAGKDAGFVTTTRVTHASPSGTYAHSASRYWESDRDLPANIDPGCRDIAYQLIHDEPGKNFKVILGGGRREFRPNTTVDEEGEFGVRQDGLNLIEDWQVDKNSRNATNSYVWNRNQLQNVDIENTDYLLGLFEATHLHYHLESDPETEPTLEEMTETAIRMLSKNENGYFLFVEAGRIDHAHHENVVNLALSETAELSKTVELAVSLTDEEDTLIVVSADHSHVMMFNGYPTRGNNILGVSGNLGGDNIPYMTLSYSNGPGHRPEVNNARVDPSTFDITNPRLAYPAEVPLDYETHGGDDVAVFALGPYQHLFTGLYEQSNLPHIMAYASCIGPGLHSCNSARNVLPGFTQIFVALIALLVYKYHL